VRLVGRELEQQHAPVGLGDLVARPEQRRDRGGRQRRQPGFPGRVGRGDERQRGPGLDARDRQALDLLGVDRQLPGRQRDQVGLARVERSGTARIVGGDPAAREVVIDLGPHRAHRVGGGRRGIPERQHAGVGGVVPRDQRARLGEERFDPRPIDAGLAAAIEQRAMRRDDLGDHGGDLGRDRRVGQDHAVAVEHRLGHRLLGVRGIGQRDLLGVRRAEVGEQAPGGREHRPVAQSVERDRIAGLEQPPRVLEHLAGPGQRRQHLGVADMAILVGVEQVERARLDRHAAGRHRQRDPQLGVELVEVREVVGGGQRDLIDATRAIERPAIRDGHRVLLAPIIGANYRAPTIET